MKDLNFATSTAPRQTPTYSEMLAKVVELKRALDRLPKEEKFLYLLSPEAAERLKKIYPDALNLENVRIDTLGIVSPGCYLKLPDTRSTSIFDMPLDIKP